MICFKYFEGIYLTYDEIRKNWYQITRKLRFLIKTGWEHMFYFCCWICWFYILCLQHGLNKIFFWPQGLYTLIFENIYLSYLIVFHKTTQKSMTFFRKIENVKSSNLTPSLVHLLKPSFNNIRTKNVDTRQTTTTDININ